MTEPKIDPLLTAMLNRLTETAPTWHEDERELWCSLFVATVSLVYPCKPKRKRRAKKDAAGEDRTGVRAPVAVRGGLAARNLRDCTSRDTDSDERMRSAGMHDGGTDEAHHAD